LWGLFLKHSRFKGIEAEGWNIWFIRAEEQRIACKLEIQRPCACPISRGLEYWI